MESGHTNFPSRTSTRFRQFADVRKFVSHHLTKCLPKRRRNIVKEQHGKAQISRKLRMVPTLGHRQVATFPCRHEQSRECQENSHGGVVCDIQAYSVTPMCRSKFRFSASDNGARLYRNEKPPMRRPFSLTIQSNNSSSSTTNRSPIA
jgi:hypothetical protein